MPGPRKAVDEDERDGHRPLHLDRDQRHPPAPARLRGRAGALRPGRRVHIAGLALDAARARAGTPLRPAHVVARRRARGRLLRPRGGQGDGKAGRGRVHERDGGRPLPAGRDRGPRGACPAHRPHGRSPARAARGRRRADDRPAQALRVGGEMVLRGRHPSGVARPVALDSAPGLPRLRDRRIRAPRARAPELRAARAARARRAAAPRRTKRGRRTGADGRRPRRSTSTPANAR